MFRFLTPLLLAASLSLVAPAFAGAATVDINKASQAELETVKGIGPAMSTKILTARKSGEFKTWDDLVQRVSGMGPGNARRMSDAGLRVAGSAFHSTTAVAAKAPRDGASHRGAKPAGTSTERKRGDASRPAGSRATAPAQG